MFEDAQMISCDDAAIAVYCCGHGKPLVLLHGNGEDSTYFKGQFPELTRFFRVIAVDSRGHGRSESGKVPLSFDRMAEDLKIVLDTLGIQRAHILGFSDGGNLAIKFTLKYPQYVDKLILNGANVEMFRGIKPYFQLPVYPLYGLLCAAARYSGRAMHRRDVLGLMVHSYGVTMEDLVQIQSPTLLIVGEHDVIRDRQTREIAAKIKDSRITVFRDGDHFCAAKQPARFNRTVIQFLVGKMA